jgi:hypothetical protein
VAALRIHADTQKSEGQIRQAGKIYYVSDCAAPEGTVCLQDQPSVEDSANFHEWVTTRYRFLDV